MNIEEAQFFSALDNAPDLVAFMRLVSDRISAAYAIPAQIVKQMKQAEPAVRSYPTAFKEAVYNHVTNEIRVRYDDQREMRFDILNRVWEDTTTKFPGEPGPAPEINVAPGTELL